MMATNDVVVVLSTTPVEDSMKIAHLLVEEGLAACVNMTGVRSCFRWQGEISLEHEDLLIIKTRKDQVEALVSRIRDLHSYELPEIIALPIVGGYAKYLEWIAGAEEI